jgi:hypothetical protein
MLGRSGLIAGALAALFLAVSPGIASAGGWGAGPGHGGYDRHARGGHDRHDHGRHDHGRWNRTRHHRITSVYDNGRCRIVYTRGPRGATKVVRCRNLHRPRRDHGDDFAIVLSKTVIALLANGGYVGAPRPVLRHNVADVLDRAPDGQGIVWDEPAENTRYQVVPTETYTQADGRYCREYVTTATVGGQTQTVYGQACRQPDGTWEIVQ